MKTNVRRHLRRTKRGISTVTHHFRRFNVGTFQGLKQAERYKMARSNAGDRVIVDGNYGNTITIETIPDKNAKKTTARIFKRLKKAEQEYNKKCRVCGMVGCYMKHVKGDREFYRGKGKPMKKYPLNRSGDNS